MHRHIERHRMHRIGWLRAAVLGANDGIVSTASLVLGVAAAGASAQAVLVAGVAGLVAGAMSMAAGEYVSVSSQADTERADLDRERKELAADPAHEHEELAAIYRMRGLDRPTAEQVAVQLMAHDALGAHARDELGIVGELAANPVQAALASAGSFSVGAALPLLVAWLAPDAGRIAAVAASSLACLVALGVVSAKTGGSPVLAAASRVAIWGVLAMAATMAVGKLFGVATA
jgi:VIT1/CCC1 family predicted Fe2+/Mn2+ transporter